MKRFLGALLLTLGLVAGPLTAVSAAPPTEERDSVKGAACGDITGDANYTNLVDGTARVYADFQTAKPSCDRATYTLTIYSTGASPEILGQTSVEGDGVTSQWAGETALTVVPDGAPGAICAVLTSSIGGRTVDQAPDTADGQCSIGVQRNLNGGVGASGMR